MIRTDFRIAIDFVEKDAEAHFWIIATVNPGPVTNSRLD